MIHEAYRYIRARHPVSGAVRWSIGPLRASFGWRSTGGLTDT